MGVGAGIAMAAGGSLLSPIAQALGTIYGIAGEVNEFIDDHIEKLKTSENPTVSCTGRVLESAKYGFGIGYISSVVIIAAGQFLLGNTFSAIGTVVTGATLTNPIAMTCAAVGAIYYGWSALSDSERNEILERLASGLETGIELVRSLIDFVCRFMRDALSSKQLAEFKAYVAKQANLFGRSLYDITGKVGDLVKGAADKAADLAESAMDTTAKVARSTYSAASAGADTVSDAVVSAAEQISESAAAAKQEIKRKASRMLKGKE